MKGKPPVAKNKKSRKHPLKLPNERLYQPPRYRSQQKMTPAVDSRYYRIRNEQGLSPAHSYTLDKRNKSRSKKRDPAKKYLNMKKSQELPADLKYALENKSKLNNIHLVDIYGINGEKEAKVHKKRSADIRTRSHSAVQKSKLMV